MSAAWAVALYSAVIVLGAVAAALVPLYTRAQQGLVWFLAFAAGVMLGAAFFHMLPEAYGEGGGYAAFVLVPVGFVVLFLLERLFFTHPHEEGAHQALGLTAFAGLSVHTIMDGVALGSATLQGVGATAFLAILAHKVPSALSLASMLRAGGRRAGSVLLLCAVYGLMVPLGAAVYLVLQEVLPFETFAPRALAFSAGTFLYIAVADLLPHVHRSAGGQRLRPVLALAMGLALMAGLTRWVVHPHT
ncbi:MAG: ZIP family metal transporter [Myxococcaceae bacterium]|nr:ZIP family metal transporter [Myxococcaceae bacterium]MCI0673015.1 ZIP family metal transporter [Myxococcaceae bacterium]